MARAVPTAFGLASWLLVVSASAQTDPSAPTVPDADPSVEVRGIRPPSLRGAGSSRIRRELLEASPRQHSSELLSAAPGFFVDHEDGEGLGNDVYLRGFDLEHGSGIEMSVGGVPLNIPVHVHGQGYADVDFVIPEVVDAIRVQPGPYDPRQGDAAIVGSAAFDLGVPERGYRLKASYGSFNQRRVLAIAAPKGMSTGSFLAFAARESDGFGDRRGVLSGSLNAQLELDLGPRDTLRVLTTAHGARSKLAGVVREDDVDAGRIGFYGSYPFHAGNQSAQSARVITALVYTHHADDTLVTFAPWFMWTDFRVRENYSGALETSQIDPALSGLGDLFESINAEHAAGMRLALRSAPSLGRFGRLTVEPGAHARVGRSQQAKSLLRPADGLAWDRRLDVELTTIDAGAYFDAELELWDRLRISGGPRLDVLARPVEDRLTNVVPAGSGPEDALPGSRRAVLGLAMSPRVVVEYSPVPLLTAAVAYGEGFRSLEPSRLKEGAKPYSKVRSFEASIRARDARTGFASSIAFFQTHVGHELVFVAEEGGLESQNASTRRGVVGSAEVTPAAWLRASCSLSVVSARYDTHVAGVSHYVPNVPPLLFRTDVTANGRLVHIAERPLHGRLGVGYTFMSGRHLSDAVLGPVTHVLNAGGELRYGGVALGVDVYNALGIQYADSADFFVSNWSLSPGQQRASSATHVVAAPPRTVVGSLSLYF